MPLGDSEPLRLGVVRAAAQACSAGRACVSRRESFRASQPPPRPRRPVSPLLFPPAAGPGPPTPTYAAPMTAGRPLQPTPPEPLTAHRAPAHGAEADAEAGKPPPRRHGLAVHLSPNGDGERVGDVAVVIGDGRALKTTMLIHIGHATEQLNNPGQAPSARDRHPLLKDGVGGQLRHRALRVAHQPDKVRTLSP